VAVNKVDTLATGLNQYESIMHKEYLMLFYFGFSYSYFGVGEYNKALHWLNKALNDNEGSLRQDFYSYIRLYNLAVHYELGNTGLLQYTIQSTTRYLQKRTRDFPVEKAIIQNFRKLIKTETAADKKKAFTRFREDLNEVIQTPEDRVIMRYFDYLTWIESKLSGLKAN